MTSSKQTQKRQPLISESVLDSDVQKQAIVGLFVLVQAWKVYDLIVLNTDSISSDHLLSPKLLFVIKYFALDTIVISVVPFLNLPQLPLTIGFCLLTVTIINSVTLLLTIDFTFSILTLFSSAWYKLFPPKELAIMETYVNNNEFLLDQSHHFKGKKTLRTAPDSSIKINPYFDSFCLKPIYNYNVKLPIRIQSSYDIEYLQINHLDINNVNTVHSYTKKEIGKYITSDLNYYATLDASVLTDDSVFIYEFPFDKPGYYSIKTAIDKKDKAIRIFKSNTVVPMCPEAAFSPLTSNSDKCVDDSFDPLQITVLGVPPFTLFYEEEIDGVLSNLPQTTVIPNEPNFKSPLLNSKTKFSYEDLSDISWAKSKSIDLSIGNGNKFVKNGKYVYTIHKIVDGFGNLVNYSPDPKILDSYLTFNVHPIPSFSLIDTTPSLPILIGKDKFIDVKLNNINCAACEAPFHVGIKYSPFKDDDMNEEEIFYMDFDFKTPAKIQVEKPGVYSIESGRSEYCVSKSLSSSIDVNTAALPKVKVDLDPIVDTCVGTTGFKFNFKFSGTPPFQLGYKISKLDPKDSTKVLKVETLSQLKTSSIMLEHIFNPSSEGSYSIEFFTLSDKYYKNQVKFKDGEYKYITYFQQRPKAYFSSKQKKQPLNICNGDKETVDLLLEGKTPFKVVYDIISPDASTETFSVNEIYDSKLKIETSELVHGGEYIIVLKDVQDSSTCKVTFKGEEVHLKVKHDVPQLSFNDQNRAYEIVQGKWINVPLKSTSSEPLTLVFNHKHNGETRRIEASNLNSDSGLKLSKEGEYELVSFTQGGCKGIVSDSKAIIKYLPKPTLRVIANEVTTGGLNKHIFESTNVCQDKQAQVDIALFGAAPFIIDYDVERPNGVIERVIEQANANKMSMQLQTDMAGHYSYTINGIYDTLYTEEVIKLLKSQNDDVFEPITITHKVNSIPQSKFLNSRAVYQTCVALSDTKDNVKPISLKLSGELPIKMKLNVYHEHDGSNQILEFENLHSHQVNLYSVYETLDVGTHVLSIYEVTDSLGCVYSDYDLEREDTVTIQVNDLPKIRHLVEESKQIVNEQNELLDNYYCVGDHISYLLNGVAPFTITYDFNDQIQKRVEIPNNYFKRRAPGPGKLNILSLSDSSAKGCEVDFTSLFRRDLEAVVHELPSVEIIQGDSIEEDIHEGEQVEIRFVLSGTPPFKLTYVRTELDDERKIVETEVIDNILQHEYRIYASLEGTYEAVEIQDKYCLARNPKLI